MPDDGAMAMGTARRARRLVIAALLATVLVPLEMSTSAGADPVQWFDFIGGGYGHGVGLSQYGAKGRADAGQGAAQIVGAYYPGATLTTRAPSGMRVKVGDTTSTVLTQPAGTMVVSADGVTPIGAAGPGTSIALTRSGGSVIVAIAGGAILDLGATGYIGITQGTPVASSATGRHYRWGRLVVRPNSIGSLELVLDQLSLEQWMYGIAEVPASWPLEALKAQAIAARTFGAYRQASPRSLRYDTDHLAGDGTYLGFDHEGSSQGSRWIQAVDETAGQILTSGGSPITAFYSSSNGGWTETSSYVFVASLPYLVAAPDPFDQAVGNANFSWKETYSGAELGGWLRAAGQPDVGDVAGIDVVSGAGASGRLDKATIRVRGANGGSFTVTGNQLRTAVNAGAPSARDLLSTKFTIGGGTAPHRPPVGSIELVFPWGPSDMAGVGWATDLDAPDDTMVMLVAVNGQLAGAVWANGPRPDVAAHIGITPNHGYGGVIRAPAAKSNVCIYAVNAKVLSASLLGCRQITRPAPKKAVKKKAAKKKATQPQTAKRR
jgi:SpoIID/LytB domain protein